MAGEDEQDSSRGGRASFQFSQENRLVAEAEQTTVAINRWRLQWLCHELQSESNATKFRDVLPWFTAFTAFLFALVPADFKDFLTLAASTWEALAILCAILCGGMTLYTLGEAAKHALMDKRETPEQIVHRLIREMESGRQSPSGSTGAPR